MLTMAPTVERITEIPNLELGEAPHWDSETQSLYFVDVFGKSINKYVPSTGLHTKAQLEKSASVIIPVKGKTNQFVCGIQKEISIVTWDGQSEQVSKIEKIAEVEPGHKNNLNDGKCDAKGRLWIGSFDEELISKNQPREGTGSLFLLENKRISTHVSKVGCSNGLAWNKEHDKFYYIDTHKKRIDSFDFDFEKGLSNRTTTFTLSKNGVTGFPDGMTIDVDGNLWVAVFGGSSVLKIDPRTPETLLERVEIPGKQVTSLAWGGPNLNELYVTTGRMLQGGEVLLPPIHGGTYKITNLETTGLPAENFVL